MVIGATIVSLGTTLPEFMVSMTAAFTGGTEIAYGNAIGSIICNTGLIGSVAIVFGTFCIRRKQIFKMIAFLAAMLGFTAFCIIGRGEVTRFDGILLFLMLALYILSCYEKEEYPVQTDDQEDTKTMEGLMMAIGIAAVAVSYTHLRSYGSAASWGAAVFIRKPTKQFTVTGQKTRCSTRPAGWVIPNMFWET